MYAIIVDSFSSGFEYLSELKKNDIKIVSVISKKAKYLNFKEKIEDIIDEEEEYSDLIKKIKEYVENGKILFCLPGSKSGVELAEKIANTLQLKTNLKDFSRSRVNKYLMQERMKDCGLKSIKQTIVTHLDEEKYGFNYPVILKPTQSAGSDAVCLCKSKKDLVYYLNTHLAELNKLGNVNNEVLMQEFIEGTEFIVDLATYDQHSELIAMWEYEKQMLPEGAFIYSALKLLDSQHIYFQKLLKYSLDVIHALGVRIGPSHVKIMMNKKEELVLIDVGSCPHGGKSQFIMKECLEYNQISRSLDLILKGTKVDRYYPKKYAQITFLISKKSGVFQKFSYLNELKKLQGFSQFFPYIFENEKLVNTMNLFTTPGIVIFIHKTEAVVKESVRQFRALELQEDFYQTKI
ncbi:ATP-grasp domain-containing protein [Fluviispira multicolorata]|uniref:ATP-grasp domain-containing protein n=1 Tax=Fluviispira multicolorata TaxID=2654512 RepID=A0A833JDZ4_9BACT|nr:ATP-grasp domain-containing protein [Fluviispira multicolorata]KAB8029675.1 ATP-grasp domain-containing protein [Fluviispira multicolorata]